MLKNKALTLIYLSEFTTRFCVWALISQLLVHLIKNNWMSGPEQLYIIGASLSLLYFSPLFGGLIKDWLFNEKQAVMLGIAVIAIGNLILLFVPHAFYGGLGFVLLGSGLVTPNTPLLLSAMTNLQEDNRTKLFTIFYGVSNSGVILGPIISGLIIEYFNWRNLLIVNELMILIWMTGIMWSAWLLDFKKLSLFKSIQFLGLFAVAVLIAFLYLKFQVLAEIILSLAALGVNKSAVRSSSLL